MVQIYVLFIFQIYPLVADSIFNVLQVAISTHHPLDSTSGSAGGVSDEKDISHDRILAWTLLVIPHLTDTLLCEYMPHFLSYVEYFVVDDVARTKLITESAVVLLLDTVNSVSGRELIRSPALLHEVMSHPLVAASLLDDDDAQAAPKCPNITTRERLVTALCRLVVKMLPISIARFVAAHQTSPLQPSSVEEIHQLAAEVKKVSAAANVRDNAPTSNPSTTSVFGNETIDLFPSSIGGDGIGSQTADVSPDSTHSTSSSGYGGLLAGLGVHLEIHGVSLRTLQPPQPGQLPPAEMALEEVHRLVAIGVLVSRSAQRCFLWRCEGLGGMVAQLSYIDLLQGLAEVLTPVCQGDAKNVEIIEQQQGAHGNIAGVGVGSTQLSLLHMSVIWARAAFTDLVHSILTLLSTYLDRQRKVQQSTVKNMGVGDSSSATIPHCVMLPFLKFVSLYLNTLFGDTAAKPKQEKVNILPHLLVCIGVSVMNAFMV